MMSVLEQAEQINNDPTRQPGPSLARRTNARRTQSRRTMQVRKKESAGRVVQGSRPGLRKKSGSPVTGPWAKERQRDSGPGMEGSGGGGLVVGGKTNEAKPLEGSLRMVCCTVSCPAAPPSSIAGIRIGMGGDWGWDASPTAPFGRGQRSRQRASDWRLPGCRTGARCSSPPSGAGRGSWVSRCRSQVAGRRLQVAGTGRATRRRRRINFRRGAWRWQDPRSRTRRQPLGQGGSGGGGEEEKDCRVSGYWAK